MYDIGDMIIYGSTGVCRVSDIGVPDFFFGNEGKTCYRLEPVFSTEVIYIALDTDIFMRRAMTREEAEAFIDDIPKISGQDYYNSNTRILTEHYQEFFQSHSCEDLMRVLKSVYEKGQQVQNQGKTIGATDKRFKDRAEDLLYSELAVALDIPLDTVESYIGRRIEEKISSDDF